MNLTLTNPTFVSIKNSFVTLIKDVLNYVKRPSYIQEDASLTVSEKIKSSIQLLILQFCMLPILVPIIQFTKEAIGAKTMVYKEDWFMYVAIVLLAPLSEEGIFRATLRFSRSAIALLVTITFITIGFVFDESNLHRGFMIIGSLAVWPLISFALKPVHNQLEMFWAKAFPYIFHIIAISFGLIHLTNYTGITNIFLAIPLVFSQLIAGYVFGYVRMKFGLKYSIGMHITWNFIVSLSFLFELIAKV